MGVAPRPPYSFGQCRQAHPASAFFFCQAFAAAIGSIPLRSRLPNPDDSRSAFNSRGALASIQARTSARKAASAGVSSKFMVLSQREERKAHHRDTEGTEKRLFRKVRAQEIWRAPRKKTDRIRPFARARHRTGLSVFSVSLW